MLFETKVRRSWAWLILLSRKKHMNPCVIQNLSEPVTTNRTDGFWNCVLARKRVHLHELGNANKRILSRKRNFGILAIQNFSCTRVAQIAYYNYTFLIKPFLYAWNINPFHFTSWPKVNATNYSSSLQHEMESKLSNIAKENWDKGLLLEKKEKCQKYE